MAPAAPPSPATPKQATSEEVQVEAPTVVPVAKPRPPAPLPARSAHHAPKAPTRPSADATPTNILPAATAPSTEPTEPRPSCKPYTAATTLAGDGYAVRGIACFDANGTWRIVTERPLGG
jgi:hypothetical protein